MGSNGSKSGLYKGTAGNPQSDLGQEELAVKANDIKLSNISTKELSLEEGISRLSKSNVKFTSENVLFVAEDSLSPTKLVWLEKGGPRAGLKHITNGRNGSSGHEKDLIGTFGEKGKDIPRLIKSAMQRGKLVCLIPNEFESYDRIYEYRGKHIKIGIGSNGFIITAYPVSWRKK